MKLPNFLCPKYQCDLIRLGQKNDGGYAIPKKSLEDTKIIYGFGLCDDWSFEEDFKKLSGAKAICFDHSVNFKFWLTRFFWDLVQLLLLKKRTINDFKRFITYFKYKLFFNGVDAVHEKKIIAPVNQYIHGIDKSKITDLNQILHGNDYFKFFLKIDIEEHEYRILDQIINYQTRLTGLVIEFHNCDQHFEKIKKFIDKIELQLVHIHVNNYGMINEFGVPTVIELTFSISRYNRIRDKNNNQFPIIGLDQPNDKSKEDEPIIFE